MILRHDPWRWTLLLLTAFCWIELVLALAPPAGLGESQGHVDGVRVLILSGSNNHDWRATTPLLERILEGDGKFHVDIEERPEHMTSAILAGYDVVLSNWNSWGDESAPGWSAATREAFTSFIQRGGGLVVVHAGSSSFYDWPEYQRVSAGSWDLGRTTHGPVHEFEVRIEEGEHPVTHGLDGFRITDELWLRSGFQPGVEVLASAYSDPSQGGSGNWEPVAVVQQTGLGRTFFLVLGHDAQAMENDGFRSLLQQGIAWAAEGEGAKGDRGPVRAARDLMSDTWIATDGLGRTLPCAEELSPPRPHRKVGVFYFLWHGEHIQGGPFDITRILATDPEAMSKPDSPLWGPMHAPHHWGQSIFGYYVTQDEGVLRKHAQMLADAGVDVVVFDVTNQFTYRKEYMTLLKVWSDLRKLGNPTPQVAFLCPFWEPGKVVRELWEDLYSRGDYGDLLFKWEGKPLILADSGLLSRKLDYAQQDTPVPLKPGHTLGQMFEAKQQFVGVGGRFPTWNSEGSMVTLTLRKDGPQGRVLLSQRFTNVLDNAWLVLESKQPVAAGSYYLEASDSSGQIGWWSASVDSQPGGVAIEDHQAVHGDRTLRLLLDDPQSRALRDFFCFRKPQPDYFRGPSQPDMWSWLEAYPQHVFTNRHGLKEQMSVGVAQNAVRGRLGSMSESDAQGRSWHQGAKDASADAVLRGLNFQEQWDRVVEEDPMFAFVTGWNEWIAGRFSEFNGIREPVMFVDQFDQEHSRDIEPMKGGHGDNYYYQLVANIRRYKGVRRTPLISPQPIRIDGDFSDWEAVSVEFRDTVGDPVSRDHRGWNPQVSYSNHSGRNDITLCKVTTSGTDLCVLLMTHDTIKAVGDPGTLVVLLNIDCHTGTGLLGYDFTIGLKEWGAVIQHPDGADAEGNVMGTARIAVKANQIEISVPWRALGLEGAPRELWLKCIDNIPFTGDWSELSLFGDAAPNDRFNYQVRFSP
ncbi:MAG: ThuA domain-containing protein [Limisphaerales bacterium]